MINFIEKFFSVYGLRPTVYRSESGVALLVGVMLISVLISIMLVMSSIFLPKLKVAQEIRKSVSALYAADSAVEYCLYVDKINTRIAAGFPDTLPTQPALSNGATFTIEPSDCSFPIRVYGEYQGVRRFFEISL